MNVLPTITALCLLLSLTSAMAQENTPPVKMSRKQMAKVLAKNQITDLHDGVLLVRLQTRAALQAGVSPEIAEKVKAAQDKKNKEIIEGFYTQFDFCPVYFFTSDFSNQVRNREFKDVKFLKRNLQPDSTLSVPFKTFFTAEFSRVAQDTASFTQGYTNRPSEDGIQPQRSAYGSADTGIRALVIMSDQFIQLRRPFPYYSRTFESLPNERSAVSVVKKMNRELHKFYEKNTKK